MCRLFGVISRDPVSASYYLKDAPQSLLVQSHVDKKRKQGDGWGLGWFEAGHPKIFKSPRPIYRDLKASLTRTLSLQGRGWRSQVRDGVPNVLLGHVRWASNPLKLPRHELIGGPHTQPFSHDRWLFVHNGTLYIPREVKAELGPWAKYVKGRNDSEVLFYWLLKTVIHGSGSGWTGRLRASFRKLDKIWQSCKKRYPIYRFPYHGVNWVLTNGRMLLAFCYVDPKGFDKGKALCSSEQSYYQLQVKKSRRNVIVASEPMAHEAGWQPLKHGQLLVIQKKGSGLSTQSYQVF